MDAADATQRARSILRFDSASGLVVGAITLLAHAWLARLYGIPAPWVVFIAAANLLYGTYSGWLTTLAARGTVSRRAVDTLVIGNLAWSGVCAMLLVMLGASATVFGWLHVGIEGVFVFCLALAEWRWVRPTAR